MGEAAEDMLDGTCCEGCGELFDDILNGAEPPGFPRYCSKACTPPELLEMLAPREYVQNPPYPSKSAKRRAARARRSARRAEAREATNHA